MKTSGILARMAASVGQSIERAQHQEADAYLAQAVDHVDLELRMRELERPQVWIPSYC